MNAAVISVDDLMARIGGATIAGGDVGEGGFHLYLNDGRTLIFTGEFIIAIHTEDKRILQ